ncbi:PREDICTED: small ubiquitin-related modifier 5-like [Camelina sativa]|uniref:Small ubiquitin-related modifier n=1 Tax=Camelina sativa TaxID=90675 RepID=A0ABM0SNU3_CAMSA|nr:PREDICTED: small ubiquitin-related modifier 5-like [Camelina sativa]XP_010413951.1 PREDICTED: small ubiquitin-related modifier 5-like [Camelina sativa]
MVSSSDTTNTISVSFLSKRSRSPEPPHQKLTLKVKNQQGAEDIYKIGAHAHLKKLMTAYCRKRNLEYNTVRFLYNNKPIKPRQTPAQLRMEEEDEILLVMELGGGGPYTPC